MKVIRVITIMTEVRRVGTTRMTKRYVGTVSFPTTEVHLGTLSLWSGTLDSVCPRWTER